MPYLSYAFCERCGRPCQLDIAEAETISAYIKEGRKSAHMNPANVVWDYLIYACTCCGAKYKYTYKDIEQLVRQYFFDMGDKYTEYFEELQEAGDVTNLEALKKRQARNVARRVDERYSKK